MLKIERLDLLCDITDGSPQNEYLATAVKKEWLIHLKDEDINHKLTFFNFLLDNKIISFQEYSEAYKLAHVLNWRMESNAITAKQALENAGYYNSKAEEQQPENKPPKQANNESPVFTQNNQQQKHEANSADLLLVMFFGTYHGDFLREAKTRKNGTEVAILVNWYINEYDLDKDRRYRKKPLHDALFAKGIIKIGVNGWNKAIK